MEKKPTKAEIRASLEADMRRFMEKGGSVSEIERGISGRDDPSKSISVNAPLPPKQARTPLNDVVDALDERKAKKAPKSPVKTKRKGPVKKLITDDFGEPVRWVWVDPE